ncbi:MAG: hypothetical protein EAX95_14600 [Candidatus Thorarchaeota archaeon]|nr:hypothetical protein [Candidatus Thorarchaeota archaeon]
MSSILDQLEGIHTEIKDKEEVSKETRKQFWKLLRQIKREPAPDIAEVKKATEIRNHLFRIDRGKTYRIGPFLALETVCGLFSFVVFLYGLGTPVDWFSLGSWSISEVVAVVIRFFGLFFVVAFFYPYGRLIAGSALGIRLEAMCYDEYREPTLKIDYESFLLASPPKRKWFFFFSGLWTLLTSLLAGMVGLILAGDILGIGFALLLVIFYVYVIHTGTTSHGRGEMAHYNREKKIERAWKGRIS